MDRRSFLQKSSVGSALTLLGQSAYSAGELDEAQVAEIAEEIAGADFFTSAQDSVVPAFVDGNYFSGSGGKPFAIYQLKRLEDGKYDILDPGTVEPAMKGSDENPDIGMRLSLVGAHFGNSVWDGSRADTRATIRITSKSDTENNSDTLHWALTAGLNIYEAYKGDNKITNPIELGTRLVGPGQSLQFSEGAGALQISVLRHKKPAWWNKIFSFLRGSGGDALIGALGFPAITLSALKFVDELTNRVADKGRQPIFEASFASVAFSERGLAGANYPAVLNDGLWLVVNPNDKEVLDEYAAYFYGGFARLIPGNITEPNKILVADDPFKNITYSVIRADLTSANFL